MKIATWNVNSVRKRTGNLLAWLQQAKPDVVVLQEIKAQEPQFPRLEVEAAGYKVGDRGPEGLQRCGHALAASVRRSPPAPCPMPWPMTSRRATSKGRIATPRGPLTVGGLYLPNGNPIGTEKFAYKLAWMERLYSAAPASCWPREEMFVLGGDYNVCPTEMDVFDPKAFANDALCQPQSRAALRKPAQPRPDRRRPCLPPRRRPVYTFWDYQAGAWAKN